jgi:phage FluMu protein Com
MALFRCDKCGHLREVANDYIGKAVKCPNCKQITPVHDTVAFVEKMLGRYRTQYNELNQLRKQLTTPGELERPVDENQALDTINIYNTTALTKRDQYEPILNWFQQRQIQVEVNQKAIDTTGFFDEVALTLGNQYEILREVSDKIKYIQRKGYTDVKLVLSKKSQKEIKAITEFCQKLYEYSFVAKFFYQKQEKIIRLKLQTAPSIINFFNGEWLEWFVFMKLIEFFREKQLPAACLRNLSITFANEDLHELDIFFMINNRVPVCIECKSGEFRQQIDKYLTLRKRLNMDETQFLLCVIGLSTEQTQGLTSMYGVTFANERNFLQCVEQLL